MGCNAVSGNRAVMLTNADRAALVQHLRELCDWCAGGEDVKCMPSCTAANTIEADGIELAGLVAENERLREACDFKAQLEAALDEMLEVFDRHGLGWTEEAKRARALLPEGKP